MKILDRYLALAVIAGSLMVLTVLMALTLFVGLVGQLGNVGTGDYDLVTAAAYVVLGLPGQAVDLMPVAVLIGTLLGLGALASQNELTVMRAAGMPISRVARGAVYGGLLLAAACVLLAEWVAPPAERHADSMRAAALYQNVNILGRGGAWLREGDQFINTRQATAVSQVEGLYLYEFDEDNRLTRAAHASQARHQAGAWRLDAVSETRPGEDRVESSFNETMDWESGVGPELLGLISVSPDMLSARGLWRYIQYLEGNNLDADAYRIAFWFKLVIPLALPVMVLLAMPFLFGSLRSAGAGQRLMVGLVVGIGFYLVNITLLNVGAVLPLTPFLVAWLPTLLLLGVSLGILRRI